MRAHEILDRWRQTAPAGQSRVPALRHWDPAQCSGGLQPGSRRAPVQNWPRRKAVGTWDPGAQRAVCAGGPADVGGGRPPRPGAMSGHYSGGRHSRHHHHLYGLLEPGAGLPHRTRSRHAPFDAALRLGLHGLLRRLACAADGVAVLPGRSLGRGSGRVRRIVQPASPFRGRNGFPPGERDLRRWGGRGHRERAGTVCGAERVPPRQFRVRPDSGSRKRHGVAHRGQGI